MRTIYVLIATKQYDTAPKVLRAFHTEADAAAMKEIIDACNPSMAVEIFPTQIDWPEKSLTLKTGPAPIGLPVGQPTATWVGSKDDLAVGWDGRSARLYEDGGPLLGVLTAKPHAADPPVAFIPENPDGPTAA